MASDLTPGVCQTGDLDPAGSITISTGETLKPGYVSSITQSPPTNVEAGRTQQKSCYTTVNNDCDPIPDQSAEVTIGDVNVTGATDPVALTASNYSASLTGSAGDATYLWTTTDGSAVIATADQNSTDITFSAAGTFTVTCTVNSTSATDSPETGTLSVTATAAPIGTVSIAGDDTADELVAESYSASISGTATDATYAWTSSDGSAQFTAQTSAATDVTFSTDGTFTLTCTVSSGTATDSPQAATKTVVVNNVVQPLTIALTSGDFTQGQAMPDAVGANVADPANLTNPALAWAASGDNTGDIATYVLSCVDTTAGGYVHWSVSNIANSTAAIASTADPAVNNWTVTPVIANTSGGPGAALANGWEPAAPPSGQTHNYSFTIQAMDAGGQQLAVSNTLVGTYSTP